MKTRIAVRWPDVRELAHTELDNEQRRFKGHCKRNLSAIARFYKFRSTGLIVYVVLDEDATPDVVDVAADKILTMYISGRMGTEDAPAVLQ